MNLRNWFNKKLLNNEQTPQEIGEFFCLSTSKLQNLIRSYILKAGLRIGFQPGFLDFYFSWIPCNYK